jgi:hypothetical protein
MDGASLADHQRHDTAYRGKALEITTSRPTHRFATFCFQASIKALGIELQAEHPYIERNNEDNDDTLQAFTQTKT